MTLKEKYPNNRPEALSCLDIIKRKVKIIASRPLVNNPEVREIWTESITG